MTRRMNVAIYAFGGFMLLALAVGFFCHAGLMVWSTATIATAQGWRNQPQAMKHAHQDVAEALRTEFCSRLS
jgi:hypothetical protein